MDTSVAGRLSDQVVAVGLGIAALTVTAQSVAHVVGVRLLDDRFLHLNADDEHGVPAWTSSAATFAAAFAVLLLALGRERIVGWLAVLASLLAFFSLDDAVVIHERLSENVADALGYGETAQRVISVLAFTPLFALALWLLVRAGRQLSGRVQWLLYGGIVLLGTALATELASSILYEFADVSRGTWPDTIEVVIEESLELGGWILIGTAFLAAFVLSLGEDRGMRRRTVES
jgi:hypothetical protein